MSETKPFYELNHVEIMNMGLPMLEYQLQEGVPSVLAAHKIAELAANLFTAKADLRQALHGRDHLDEWWKTFRVALGGYTAAGRTTMEESRDFAVKMADLVHGPIGKPTTE